MPCRGHDDRHARPAVADRGDPGLNGPAISDAETEAQPPRRPSAAPPQPRFHTASTRSGHEGTEWRSPLSRCASATDVAAGRGAIVLSSSSIQDTLGSGRRRNCAPTVVADLVALMAFSTSLSSMQAAGPQTLARQARKRILSCSGALEGPAFAAGEAVRVRFFGTRGSIATPGPQTLRYGGNTSCVEVRSKSGTLAILDMGTGAVGLGRQLMARGEPLSGHILISHTHWDHIQGIPFFAPLFVPGFEWDIYAPRGIGQTLRQTSRGPDAIHLLSRDHRAARRHNSLS